MRPVLRPDYYVFTGRRSETGAHSVPSNGPNRYPLHDESEGTNADAVFPIKNWVPLPPIWRQLHPLDAGGGLC